MDHILDPENDHVLLYPIFENMRNSNAILLLGAGASVGEKRYLSKEIIQYYESYLGLSLDEPDITRFLDILQTTEKFDRKHFDSFVTQLLHALAPNEGHHILATIPWREIITTNFDLIVERAYDEMIHQHKTSYNLVPIKSVKEYYYRESNSEIKYIKLNGCIQDTQEYPLAFSTDDFNQKKAFYKAALSELRNPSPGISFISMGYSYSDAFGRELLAKFDQFNFRDRKWMINVDPFPNMATLPFYTKNRIQLVKCSFERFFQLYKTWEEEINAAVVKKRGLTVKDSKNQYVSVPHKLLIDLEGVIKQLNRDTKDKFIKDTDFYKGEEPTFNLITRGVDVIRTQQIERCKATIIDLIEKPNGSVLLPIFFLVGDFGIGKSTFTYRLIYELEQDLTQDIIAFEIIDFLRLKKDLLIQLISTVKAKRILIFCDEIEIESYFKALLEMQRGLSIEQFQDCNIFFLAPVRENILEMYRLNRAISNSHQIRIEGKLSKEETDDLLEKLKNAGLINYRDTQEKRRFLSKITSEYDSDSFISLMSLVTSGRHENDLISSYTQLSKDAKNAFLYTALLHKHKLLMPASWLKQNISMSWEEFTTRIIKAEGQGILIQEIKKTHGTQPDLYFRTKHPIIADRLVQKFLPNKDKQFDFYEKMLRTIEPGQTNSYLANDLLKAFARNEDFNPFQVNRFFDSAFTRLSDDPYFLLNYAINLQSRRNIPDLKKGLAQLVYAESLLQFRNHRFIHRRGVLCFDLAKLYLDDNDQLAQVTYYLNEAKDLFFIKQLMDPTSAYSYVDYIKLLVWELENVESSEDEDLQKQIHIQELFDLANENISEGIEKINKLHDKYSAVLKNIIDAESYQAYLEKIYESFQLKPYACILLYKLRTDQQAFEAASKLIDEMEYYQENFEVVKFLFTYYGENLYNPNIRIKFLKLSEANVQIEKENHLKYNYYNFMAESYNFHFYEGRTFLFNIQNRYSALNPQFHCVWKGPDGNEGYFDGVVIKNSNERFKAIKLLNLQQNVRLMKGSYDQYILGSKVKVKLHFYLYGLLAEIITDMRQIPENDR